MTRRIPSFDEYLRTLGRLTGHVDPTASTPEAENIRDATASLSALQGMDASSLAAWVEPIRHGYPCST